MIDRLIGTVVASGEKEVTLLTQGIGFGLLVPNPAQFTLENQYTIFTYVSWSAERGATLYGFHTEVERTVFLLIIQCQKIGPALALTILSQLSAERFLEIVASQHEKALSALHGIGPKKAQQIVMQLKEPVGKLLATGILSHSDTGQASMKWQHVSEALESLSYSRQEVVQAVEYISEKYRDDAAADVNTLLRTALRYLAETSS